MRLTKKDLAKLVEETHSPKRVESGWTNEEVKELIKDLISTRASLAGMGGKLAGVQEKCSEYQRAAENLRRRARDGWRKDTAWRLKNGLPVKSENPYGYTLREQVFMRDENRCRYCGSQFDLTVDHFIPKSRGGRTVMENLVTACDLCNRRKGSRILETLPLMPGEKGVNEE